MNKIDYTITSPRFSGEVAVTFTDGYCSVYNALQAGLNDKQAHWFLSRVILPEKDFLNAMKQMGCFTVVGARQELTFDMFWDRYDEKDRSSKKKARSKWQRMSKEQQLLAYSHIPVYFRNIPSGVSKKYAETYLNSEIWNN